MKILCTGAAGYLGSVLCEMLCEKGHDVTGLDNLMYGQDVSYLARFPNFTFIRNDVRDIAVYGSSYDFFLPLAAIVGAYAVESYYNAYDINVEQIEVITKFSSNDQRVIFPTTNSGYGINTEGISTEESELNPLSSYGQQKVEAEKIVAKKVNYISLRLATVFGASYRTRLDLLVNDLVYRAVTQGYLVIFEKDFKRNYIHVRDVARAFIHCIDNWDKLHRNTFNVGNDALNMSKAELAEAIKEELPDLKIIYSEIGSDPDKRNYTVSSEKFAKTGFECKYSLKDGIRELIRAYRMLPTPVNRNA